MAENDILGISGQMDITDIQSSFDKMFDNLDRLGIKTEDVNNRMTKALNDISQSASSDSEKTKQAIEVLKMGLAEISQSLSAVPENLKKMSSEAQTAENTIGRLGKKLSEAEKGSDKWKGINEQLSKQREYATRLNDEYTSLMTTFNGAQQYIGSLNAAIDILNAGQSISNASTIMSGAAHAGVTATVSAESVSHAKNAEEISNETQKISENTEATNNATDASKQRVENINSELEALQRFAEQIKQGSVSEEQYVKVKEDANTRYEQLVEERNRLSEKQQEIQKKNDDAYNDMLSGKISSESFDAQLSINQQIVDSLQEQKTSIGQLMQQLQDGIQQVTQSYSALNETQQQTSQISQENTSKEIEDTNRTKDAIREKESELQKLNEQLELMQAHHDAGWGGDFISKYRKGENPFGAISDFWAESKDIEETKLKISEVTSEIERLKSSTQDVGQSASEMSNELSSDRIITSIRENEEELKRLNDLLKTAKAAGNTEKAEELKNKQQEINKEIDEGKEKLQQMGISYMDVAKQASNAAKETNKIGGNKNSDALGQIKKITGELKSGFSGGFSVGSISKMIFSTTGAWVAGIGAAASAVKWVSDQNRMLDESMMSLKGYLDSGVLQQLREQYVQLEYDSTHSAEEMAAAGTRWVKYFEDIRGNADVIADVTEVSNNLATVLGTTSEKAADYILKIAGAYHQTAAEAKENATILINASKNSTAKYEELAQAISSSANRAAQSGANIKEFTSAVAYTAGTFGNASSAASTYTMMLQRLSAQSKNEYNPSVVGASKALENLSKSQTLNDTLTGLLGKRQAALAKIFVKNASSIKEMEEKLKNLEAATKIVNAVESKQENQEKKLQNAKRALAHELDTNLTPAYTEFLNYIAVTIKGLGRMAQEFKNFVSPIVEWYNRLDKKFSNSTIWKVLRNYGNVIKWNVPGLGVISTIHNAQEKADKADASRKKRLTDIYNKNLEKYGISSPGKAYIASVNEIRSSKGRYSIKDKDFLNTLRAKTVIENSSRTNGVNFETGEQNQVKDKKGKTEHDKKIKAQEKLAEDLKSLQQKNIDDELALQEEGTQKKIAQIQNDYKKRLDEINKQEKDFRKRNKEAGISTSINGLTEKQAKTFEKAKVIAQKAYDKQLREAREEELKSMREYLSKYGSLAQQKQAIVDDYDDKIAKAQTQGEKKTLEKEKSEKLSAFKYESISKGIDWKALLSGVGNLNEQMLKPMLDELKAYTQTDEFKNADVDTKQKTVDLINEIEKYIGVEKTLDWSDLAKAMSDFTNAVAKYDNAKKNEEEANKLKEQAKKDYENKKITQEEYEKIADNASKLGEATAAAEKDMRNFGNILNETTDKVRTHITSLTTTLEKADKTWGGFAGFSDFKSKIGLLNQTSGTLLSNEGNMNDSQKNVVKSIVKGMDVASDAMSKSVGSVLNSGVGQLIGGIASYAQIIMSIADSIKTFVTGILNSISEFLKLEWITDLVNSILEAIGNLIDTILDLPENIFHLVESVVVDGVGGLVNSVVGRLGNILSLGALSSGGPADWFTNSNAKEVAETTSRLNASNERLKNSIDDLKEELSKQSGAKAINTASQAFEDQKEIIAQQKKILQTQMNYHGSHHSNAYYWDWDEDRQKKTNEALAEYKRKNPNAETITDMVGKGNASQYDFYNLTPEQLAYLRTYEPDLWYDLTHQGKYDKSKYWENLADEAGKLEEITNNLKESLTQTTFDSLKNDFISSLMDMSKNAQDFSDDFSQMLMKSVLNAKISDLMDDELQAFYDKWADYAKSDNTLTEDEIKELREEWEGFVQKGLDLRDQAAEITGYSSTSAGQKTSSSSAASMTQDQANELNGRFTALQIAGELHNQYLLQSIDVQKQIDDKFNVVSVDVSAIRASTVQMSQNMSELLDIQYESVDKLSKIAIYTSVLPTMNENINNIYRSVKDINRK